MTTTMTKKRQQSLELGWAEARGSTRGARRRWRCPSIAARETSNLCDRNAPYVTDDNMRGRVRGRGRGGFGLGVGLG